MFLISLIFLIIVDRGWEKWLCYNERTVEISLLWWAWRKCSAKGSTVSQGWTYCRDIQWQSFRFWCSWKSLSFLWIFKQVTDLLICFDCRNITIYNISGIDNLARTPQNGASPYRKYNENFITWWYGWISLPPFVNKVVSHAFFDFTTPDCGQPILTVSPPSHSRHDSTKPFGSGGKATQVRWTPTFYRSRPLMHDRVSKQSITEFLKLIVFKKCDIAQQMDETLSIMQLLLLYWVTF